MSLSLRQREEERRTDIRFRFDPDASTVMFDDLLARRQANPGSRVLVACMKALEELIGQPMAAATPNAKTIGDGAEVDDKQINALLADIRGKPLLDGAAAALAPLTLEARDRRQKRFGREAERLPERALGIPKCKQDGVNCP